MLFDEAMKTFCMLFDEDREPFTNTNDQRFVYLKSLATMFKNMDTYSAANVYLIKFSNRNIRKRCEIYSKLTIKTPERR